MLHERERVWVKCLRLRSPQSPTIELSLLISPSNVGEGRNGGLSEYDA